MTAASTVSVQVEPHGQVPGGMRELAEAKAEAALRFAAEPVLAARVTLAMTANPASPRPAVAQATIDLNGRVVRAQAAGETMRAAIEQMAARLRTRLGRSARNWSAQRGSVPSAEPGEWRHRSIPAHRPPYFPRPAGERQVIRRKSYASAPLTPAQATDELDLLDYDFHLFTEISTRLPSVIYRAGGGYRIAQTRRKPGRIGELPPSVSLSDHRAPRLTVTEATERLDAIGQPFVFFVDSAAGAPSLIYHRYDGHYGLVSLVGP